MIEGQYLSPFAKVEGRQEGIDDAGIFHASDEEQGILGL